MLTPEEAHHLFQTHIVEKKRSLDEALQSPLERTPSALQAVSVVKKLYKHFWVQLSELDIELNEQTETDDPYGVPLVDIAADVMPWLAASMDFQRVLTQVQDLLKNEGSPVETFRIFQNIRTSEERAGTIFSDEALAARQEAEQAEYNQLQKKGIEQFVLDQARELVENYPASANFYHQPRQASPEQQAEYEQQIALFLRYFLELL